jgi:RNase P subunit RPR2
MSADPLTCEHDWKFDEAPTKDAKPVRLKCSKCGEIKDYSDGNDETGNRREHQGAEPAR